jgi:hypothetical protein
MCVTKWRGDRRAGFLEEMYMIFLNDTSHFFVFEKLFVKICEISG